jgi:polyphosphate kinase
MTDTNNAEAKNDELSADGKLKRKEHERELTRLHVEFVKLLQWVVHKDLKVCILFEGRDGAGKGGTIKAMTERVSPRVFRVVALPAPTEREKSQMYAQRYIPHLPAAGEVVIFDRSWYNRAGVERIMGFCTEEQAKRFLEMVPAFERVIVDSGIILLKYWLEVSPEEQTRGSTHRRRAEDLEVVRYGPQILFALVRLFTSTGRDVSGF